MSDLPNQKNIFCLNFDIEIRLKINLPRQSYIQLNKNTLSILKKKN